MFFVFFYRTLWDMCRGVSISSKMAPFTLEPLRLASWRSHPERSQFWEKQTKVECITGLQIKYSRSAHLCVCVCVCTSRSVPASVAPLRLQFFSLAFFSVATLRLIPVIWLPSMSTPLRLAPTTTRTRACVAHFNMSFTTTTPLKAFLKKQDQMLHPPDWL